ncbi:nucleotide-binding protein [Klebsiella pneumoniae]
MLNDVYSGYWTGDISGSNQGGISFTLNVEGNKVSGSAKIHELALGAYEYSISGKIDENLFIELTPGNRNPMVMLGKVTVICSLINNNKLRGKWRSSIGTEGVFNAEKFDESELKTELPESNSVFLVHGHDEGTKHSVARFLEKLGVEPVILQEQINKGMTIIEKFQEFAKRAGFAVILMTPDDYGYPINNEQNKSLRARQNVILELGYFTALLGREKTMVLIKGDIEIPTDALGITYEKIDSNEGWKMRLARELKEAGYSIDMNNII